MLKFSIITPVHVWSKERRDQLYRALASVKKQTYKNFEWIVINDGSVFEFKLPKVKWLKLLHQEHLERVVALTEGFKEAKGEWFVLLDSDDELDTNSLKVLNKVIKENPDYKMFNFGARYVHNDGRETFRAPFVPGVLDVGHTEFGGGNIVNGTFIFHRSVYEDLGAFPESPVENIDCTELNYGGVRKLFMTSPYDFSAWAQIEFPEIRKYFFVDRENEPDKAVKELGNPWGQDYYLFYKYTRKYHSKPIDKYLYIVHPR